MLIVLTMNKAYRLIISIIALLVMILLLMYTFDFLASNFAYRGEAFFKGSGHLIHENPPLAIYVLTVYYFSLYFLFPIFIAFLLPDFLYEIVRPLALIIVIITFILLALYLYMHSSDLLSDNINEAARYYHILLEYGIMIISILMTVWLRKLATKNE